MRFRSLRKCKKIFFATLKKYRRKREQLNSEERDTICRELKTAQKAIIEHDRDEATQATNMLAEFSKTYLKKDFYDHLRSIVGLGFALIAAILIRQVWFELYEIPTGSMRPTLQEKDRLSVSKTTFGINTPLKPTHLYFDPDLVQRSGIFTFTTANMDIPDSEMRYFYIFPGKKQLVKRLMGKPGDTVYFYGGKLYGVDCNGNDITHELQYPELPYVDHVPFLQFGGKTVTPDRPRGGIYSPAIFYQMNQPVAKLTQIGRGDICGKMLVPGVEDYGQLWGMRNYAMAKLLTTEEVEAWTDHELTKGAALYLELTHDPSLKEASLELDIYGRRRPALKTESSIIPLTQQQLTHLHRGLYTARFTVRDGYAYRYGTHIPKDQSIPYYVVPLRGIENGTFEIREGRAYKIQWQGISKKLPEDYPLNHPNNKQLQALFNLGIEFDTRFGSNQECQHLRPSRFAWFRNGDLYVMGAKVIDKDEKNLIQFVEEEKAKPAPYLPFIDHGPPITPEGEIDCDFLQTYGLKIPEKHYLALGDNYAMSGDSRVFGFVPQGNLRGSPDFIFWPPGSRFGQPVQPPYPWLTLPHFIIWIIAAILIFLWNYYQRKRHRLPQEIE
ncbi:MAG: signal peptidase I [Candidatus Algichlamydia australiensis]|nr:signal peptidase I [Chlamydiales bacterium]